MASWRLFGIAVSAVALVDAIYLLIESLDASFPLYCPSSGAINCALVTSSAYSRFAGIPVALLGVLFFVAMLILMWVNNPSLNYLLVPLWAIGAIFVGYLVYAEVFALHTICLYCTFDHIAAVLLVVPAVKLALDET